MRLSYCLLLIVFISKSGISQDEIFEVSRQQYTRGAYDSALLSLQSLGADSLMFKVLRLKGDVHYMKYDYQRSLSYYQKAVSEASDVSDISDKDLTEAYVNIGELYIKLSLFDQSIAQSRTALRLARRFKDELSEANAMYNLSTAFTRNGVYDSAIYYIGRVYEIDLKSGDSTAISSDFNTLGFLHMQNEEYEKGLNYYHQSLAHLPKTDSYRVALRISNIGFAKMQLNEFEGAEADFFNSIIYFEKLKAFKQVIKQYINLGTLYNKMGDYAKALTYQEEAIDYADQINESYFKCRTTIQMVRTLMNLGRLKEGETKINEAIPLASELGLLEELVESYGLLSEIYEKTGKDVQAYEALREHVFFKDSLSKTQQLAEIHDLELKFVSQQKEKQIELLALENQLAEQEILTKRRNIILLIIGLVVVITAALIIYSLQRQKLRLQETIYSKEVDELKIEIKRLIGKYEGTLDIGLEELNKKLVNPLSEREYDVFKQIFSQKTNSEIAEELYVSINTVKTHLKNLYNKLGVSNRKEALNLVLGS